MLNRLKCQSLFAFESFYLNNYFSSFEYPWQIIAHLKDILLSIISDGIDGYQRQGNGVLVGKDVKISGTARIEGPTVIGDGCEIRHGAYIRGGVILGRGCVIGNSSEIKNSLLLDGAQAPHFNYVGDSLLGTKAHLGAGVICSNLRSDGKNVAIKCDGERIETGLRKLGAILGDNTEIDCGSVLCPGTVIGKNTTVYPLTMTRGYYPEGSIVKDTYSVVKKVDTDK